MDLRINVNILHGIIVLLNALCFLDYTPFLLRTLKELHVAQHALLQASPAGQPTLAFGGVANVTTTTTITEFLVAEAGVKMQFLTILCLCSQGRS